MRATCPATERLPHIAELTTFPRCDPVSLDHHEHGPARVSHQRPMLTTRTRQPLDKLLRSPELTGTTLEDFCLMLARRLSAHNAGSAPQEMVLPKGRSTWKTIENFEVSVRRIQEVVVEGSIPPLGGVIDHVRAVE